MITEEPSLLTKRKAFLSIKKVLVTALIITSVFVFFLGASKNSFIQPRIVRADDTIKITVEKYIDGVKATLQSANNLNFLMSATWNASSTGPGAGNYNLGMSGFNGDPTPYQAVISPLFLPGDSFSTNEVTGGVVVGATCASGQPYALIGYSTGDTLLQAEQAMITTSAPSFTNLLNDKFVIVQNMTCPTQNSTSSGGISGSVLPGNGSLKVDKITIARATSTADGTFGDGWQYILHITVPRNERNMAIKFADWLNDSNTSTVPVANNMRISSVQANNGGAAILLTQSNTYLVPPLTMVADLDPNTPGMQVDVMVEVSIPAGTAVGSYSTTYGIQTTP